MKLFEIMQIFFFFSSIFSNKRYEKNTNKCMKLFIRNTEMNGLQVVTIN